MQREEVTCKTVFTKSFLILLFEFLGSMVLTIFQRMIGSIMFIFAYWWIVAICYHISGSHFNPAVTVTFMLRRDAGKFNRALGFAYIFVQVCGCFVGALIAYMLTQNGGRIRFEDDEYTFQAACTETIGSLLYIFTFLLQTGRETRFSNDHAIWTLIVAACYGSVLYYNIEKVFEGSMNPAYAFGVHMTMLMDHGDSMLKYLWVFIIFPFVGGILALLFYEFVYKKTQVIVNEDYNRNVAKV